MKIAYIGIVSTAIVIVMGVFIVLPPYLPREKPIDTLLVFDIKDGQNLPQWCNDLSTILEKQNMKATIFITGQVAQKYPSCVNTLAQRNDIGTLSYDYQNLSGKNYTAQLYEVKNSKAAVDTAGNIDSKLFKASYGRTDSNIYSILNRSGILVDFSYHAQYNKYYDGKFLKFDLNVYNGTDHSPAFFHDLSTSIPVAINFDNSIPVEDINKFLSDLKSGRTAFLTASQLTGLDLTVREGRNA